MISGELLQAYRDTDYWFAGLDGNGPVSLRIGVHQPELETVYNVFKVDCAAFITACNPLSRLLSDAENSLRQEHLQDALRQLGFTALIAEGRPLRPGWKPEPSWFIPGMSLEHACEIGRRYEQHAIVWTGADRVPQLHLLQDTPSGQTG